MPKGAIVRGALENFLKDELLKRGYQPVYTPHIGKIELYKPAATIRTTGIRSFRRFGS